MLSPVRANRLLHDLHCVCGHTSGKLIVGGFAPFVFPHRFEMLHVFNGGPPVAGKRRVHLTGHISGRKLDKAAMCTVSWLMSPCYQQLKTYTLLADTRAWIHANTHTHTHGCGSKLNRRGKPQVLFHVPLTRATHFGIPVF